MNATPIDLILSRLDRPRQRQAGQWSARCPAHSDRGPSLSVRETPDGAVLVHCFAGCSAADVVAGLGLSMGDLFPPRNRSGREPKSIARVLTAGQALELLADEATLVAVAASHLGHGRALTENDRSRLLTAAGRINHLSAEVP